MGCAYAESTGNRGLWDSHGEKKAKAGWVRQIVLAFWAGAFIAFAAEGSNMAAFNLLARPETYGLGKCLAGTIFPVGLMLVMLTGAELFTGNTLMCMALAEKRITLAAMLRNWLFVCIGNFWAASSLPT